MRVSRLVLKSDHIDYNNVMLINEILVHIDFADSFFEFLLKRLCKYKQQLTTFVACIQINNVELINKILTSNNGVSL